MASRRKIFPGALHPRVADYTIVTDTSFNVSPGNNVTRTFLLPPSAVLTQTGNERPVVCYSLARQQGTPVLRVHLQLRGAEEEVFTWNAPPALQGREILQTIMEPITGTLLTSGGTPNTLVFSVTGGQVRVHNVIVLFQRSSAPGPVLTLDADADADAGS